jgi:hypothetical protein
MYSREEFIGRFKDMETALLLHRLATSELTDEARDAIYHVLHERGVPTEPLNRIKPDIPEHEIVQHAQFIKRSPCPLCHRRESGIDVRESYWVWSALIITRWQTRRAVCCRKCGVKDNWTALGFSFGLGWWGVPVGIILTPYQIIRNLLAIASKTDRPEPSKALLSFAKKNLLAQRQLELERTAL